MSEEGGIYSEAVLYFETATELVVNYGPENKRALLTCNDEDEAELVKTLLHDPNLWASFLGSLSAALTQHR